MSATSSTQSPTHASHADEPAATLVVEELVEEISIDGMCGVY